MTARERRTVWLAGALVMSAFVLRSVPLAVGVMHAHADRLAAQTRALSQTRALAWGLNATRDSLAHDLARVLALAPALIEGGTQAEASASLSSTLGLLARDCALRVIRLDPGSESGSGPIRPVSAHLAFEGDVRGVAALLRAIESRQPILRVSAFALTAPDPLPRPLTAETLHVELDVTGWYLPRGAP
jgi:hypothetical protein